MDELNRLIKVRAAALGRLSEKNIPPGAPMATLEKVLVPVYLMHRFQAEAVTKLVGGVNYTYAARGDGQPTNDPLPPEQQRAALAAVCQTLRPDFLALPPKLIALIPPAPPGYARDRESFDSHSGMVFDPQAAAESWINTQLDLLLNAERLSRLVAQNANTPEALSVNEVFNAVLQTAARTAELSGSQKEIARAIEKQFLHHLFQLAANAATEQQVSALALQEIGLLETKSKSQSNTDPAEAAHNSYLLSQVDRFRRDPKTLQTPCLRGFLTGRRSETTNRLRVFPDRAPPTILRGASSLSRLRARLLGKLKRVLILCTGAKTTSGECRINTCWTSNIRQFDGMLSATSVKDALNKTAPVSPILVQGWIRTRRDAKDFSFIELNDGSSLRNLQIIAKNSLPNYGDVQRLITGASIKVRGELVQSQGKGQSWEVIAEELTIVGPSDETYPLQKKGHTAEFLREIAHLRPRSNLFGSVFRVRSRLAYAVHTFFQDRGFFYLNTPIITGSDCEGAGELFG